MGYCHNGIGGQFFDANAEGTTPLTTGKTGKGGLLMSDYELLTVVLMILGIIVSILIAYINHTKSNRLGQRMRLLFCN